MMLIVRIDPFTGQENELELPVTSHDLLRIDLGEDADAVLAKLRPWQRDFVVSGTWCPPWLEPKGLPTYSAEEFLGDWTPGQDK
jgi:hypothetical protein